MNTKRTLLFCTVTACLSLWAAALWEPNRRRHLIAALRSANEPSRLQAIDELGARGTGDTRRGSAGSSAERSLGNGAATRPTHWEKLASRPRRAGALAELIKDSDETVRRQAVQALIAIRPGPQIMVPLCIKLFEDPDPAYAFAFSMPSSKPVPRPCPV